MEVAEKSMVQLKGKNSTDDRMGIIRTTALSLIEERRWKEKKELNYTEQMWEEVINPWMLTLLTDKLEDGTESTEMFRKTQTVSGEDVNGIDVYARIYVWYMEVTGEGINELCAKLMIPNTPEKDEDVFRSVLNWEDEHRD